MRFGFLGSKPATTLCEIDFETFNVDLFIRNLLERTISISIAISYN